MRRGLQGVALRQLTRLFESGTLSAASDRELLDLFANRRDESAFDVLMTRYGRLVLNVGRKLLHDPRDVEDAFQATFLVLVRKPPRLRVGDSLGPWMSTVAYRVAARARANRIRLNRMETTDGLEVAAPIASDTNALVLHEELNRAPRTPPPAGRLLLSRRSDPRVRRRAPGMPRGNRPQPPCPGPLAAASPAFDPGCRAVHRPARSLAVVERD